MTARAFPLPAGRAALVPSVLSADFCSLKTSLAPVKKLASWVQVDVMDGRFVPNISFGPVLVPFVAGASGLPVDAHLMVAEPLKFIDAFARAGAALITVHAEARGAAACLKKIKALGLKAGLALRLAGYENVRILQGGMSEWKARGGFDAAAKATGAPTH